MIEITAEKYNGFYEQIEQREADIFVSIPCLLILKSLEDDDKGICMSFMPMMYDEKETVG